VNNNQLTVAIGDTWQPKLMVYFGMAMMALMLITNVLNLKFVDVHGITVIASQITYVLSLVLADVMAEVYGYRRVRRLLYVGLGCLTLYAVCLQIAVALPPAQDYTGDAAFKAVFAQTPRIVTASLAAYFVTELTNSFIMSRLKVRFVARHFYGRAVTSVGLAQIVNGVTFYGIAFAGTMSTALILSAGAVSWAIVMLCEVLVLPLTRQLAVVVKQHEGIEHFDLPPQSPLPTVVAGAKRA
jgi:queuosine precursor transporter